MTRRDFIRTLTQTSVLAFMPATVARLSTEFNEASLLAALQKLWDQTDVEYPGHFSRFAATQIYISGDEIRARGITHRDFFHD